MQMCVYMCTHVHVCALLLIFPKERVFVMFANKTTYQNFMIAAS